MAVIGLILALLLAVMADGVVSVRPNNATEQFLFDCQASNKTVEECERELLQATGKQPIINTLLVEPFWYNPIALGMVIGIAAIIGYGIFSAVRYFRHSKKAK
jgi:hypothetical protein